ncbi:glycosyltransferase family 8 protein [Rhodocytophaga rosea]|uniref:Glycosyltransferase family 8 protein n=1 Tax=Rhodocytophaga rosea TaxID=2704465 RepID=A0A6C0GR52_9BACT|nr:glycosyltransferase family 8 protein [Rhodocytophaga rosea]QHT70541.1 glycosyltransferase family 8 protein [Rhodocytophaga rosea]
MNPSKELIPVVTTLDAGYLQHCAVMLGSLFKNNPTYNFHIYIIISFADNNDLQKLKSFVTNYQHALEIVRIDDKEINNFQTVHHITTATYYRLLIPGLLPVSINKVLYLDVDVIIRRDISDLWNTNIENYSVAAVMEPMFTRHAKLNIPKEANYFNAGVLLMNLEKWRKNDTTRQILTFIDKNNGSLEMLEQDALNAILYDQWLCLPFVWNVTSVLFTATAKELHIDESELINVITNPCIIHYTGYSKPWHYTNTHPFKKEYYKYLQLTPWKNFKHPEETVWHKIKQSGKKLMNLAYGRKKFEVYN